MHLSGRTLALTVFEAYMKLYQQINQKCPPLYLCNQRGEHFLLGKTLNLMTLFHEAIIFDFRVTHADGSLEQYPPRILFVGNQFVERFPIPLWLTRGRGDVLLLQPSSNLAQAVTTEVALENLADDSGLIRVHDQLAVWAGAISAAPALGHFRGAIPKASLQTVPDGFAFFRCSYQFFLSTE